ncbi:MAG: SDR family NAD(P)-dependent oxidoreductase [Chloroflexi bacterium]|nr:SDR family NAD(P)-dependent oxidoreductase [Chloroflexota bacterium]
MFSLKDKIALVTGAGSGIGASIAEVFAAAAAFVYVTDRDTQAGGETVSRLRAAGGQGEFLALDVTKESECETVGRAVRERFGRLDVLVNNAGIGHVGTALTTTGADMDRLYAVNVRGAFNVTKAFIAGRVRSYDDVIRMSH